MYIGGREWSHGCLGDYIWRKRSGAHDERKGCPTLNSRTYSMLVSQCLTQQIAAKVIQIEPDFDNSCREMQRLYTCVQLIWKHSWNQTALTRLGKCLIPQRPSYRRFRKRANCGSTTSKCWK